MDFDRAASQARYLFDEQVVAKAREFSQGLWNYRSAIKRLEATGNEAERQRLIATLDQRTANLVSDAEELREELIARTRIDPSVG